MSDLHKKLVNKSIPQGLSSRPPVFQDQKKNANKPVFKKASFVPVLWNQYFDQKDDVKVGQEIFRVYKRGTEGPILMFLHGGGFSGLSWALLSSIITDEVNCQCLAMDIRGHGDTKTMNEEDLSIDRLSQDVANLVKTMYPDECPPIIIIGHSMGGAVAAHTASLHLIPDLAGLIVIDVVEGTALDALYSMQSFLRSRPSKFRSLEYAIEWSVKSCQIRNATSARVSFPGQLKNVQTGETATSELEKLPASYFQCSETSGAAAATPFKASDKRSTAIIEEEDEEEEGTKDANGSNPGTFSSLPIQTTSFKDPEPRIPAANTTAPSSSYTWRIDLTNTENYWTGWFQGLSKKFLSFSGPKLLLLAGVDRLDKDLTIGQMQGKFQMNVLPQSGHAIHEDIPEKVADCIATYLVRNKLTTAKSDFEKVFPCC